MRVSLPEFSIVSVALTLVFVVFSEIIAGCDPCPLCLFERLIKGVLFLLSRRFIGGQKGIEVVYLGHILRRRG
ncbi:MAG TPA: hypothetical protein DHV16_02740 [Nitrospiraceae bacterium]|nr:hypothetical protein [Nitrospiraceae bacterium]HCL82072.1 hypothetical protein [Nitrospiraceae bacterium]HCZ11178.1 hypothetical protein [Nitrospiraceae bacterium]